MGLPERWCQDVVLATRDASMHCRFPDRRMPPKMHSLKERTRFLALNWLAKRRWPRKIVDRHCELGHSTGKQRNCWLQQEPFQFSLMKVMLSGAAKKTGRLYVIESFLLFSPNAVSPESALLIKCSSWIGFTPCDTFLFGPKYGLFVCDQWLRIASTMFPSANSHFEMLFPSKDWVSQTAHEAHYQRWTQHFGVCDTKNNSCLRNGRSLLGNHL